MRKGTKHSEETRRRWSEIRKGGIPWNKGVTGYTTSKKGTKLSEEHKQNMSGENNHGWKGDDVKYVGLHRYMRKHLPEPEFCQICNEKPPYDVACITGIYNRDFENWQWQCRKCHVTDDGRIKNLDRTGKIPWNKGLKYKIGGTLK